ncbi:unnamed protein product [Protopolystoma xenopodis]|uniref:Uncharacterized protein n=1 Tax=Protopolystoma xenopodis TaxID=117903 RepID=A0A448X6Y8_9PLAT|nr:unnamed protein product [Protopolystoma xenopodis]
MTAETLSQDHNSTLASGPAGFKGATPSLEPESLDLSEKEMTNINSESNASTTIPSQVTLQFTIFNVDSPKNAFPTRQYPKLEARAGCASLHSWAPTFYKLWTIRL